MECYIPGRADPDLGADGKVCQHQRAAGQRLRLKQVSNVDQVSAEPATLNCATHRRGGRARILRELLSKHYGQHSSV